MSWFIALAGVLALGGPAALAQSAGKETSGNFGWWLPESVSTFGDAVDKVFYFILYLTLVVNVLVFIAMIAFITKYRYKEGRHVKFIHGNNKLETVWTLAPTIILALTAVFSQTSWSHMKMPPASMPGDPGTVNIDIIAQQFAWNFHYPGADGKFGQRKASLVNKTAATPAEQIGLDTEDPNAKDDFVITTMTVPVGRKVYINLTSLDVIHSFFLPNFRVKQDAMPGLITKVWFESRKTSAEVVGRFANGSPKPFDVPCAELCGANHFMMRGQMFVVSGEEYDAFLAKQAALIAPAGETGGDGY